MSQIEKYRNFVKSLPEGVTLVAVSKTKPAEAILEFYNEGQRDFGENYVQELVEKQEILPKDIRWHFIGHLQSNKVKYIAPFVYLIHGVDSFKLLLEINKQAKKNNRVIDVLLQVHIAAEETKFGFDETEIRNLFNEEKWSELQNISIKGVMGMATNTDSEETLRKEFSVLFRIFNSLKHIKDKRLDLSVVSMGMSNDYEIAIGQGSNMIRIGSLIFGNRNYN